LRNGINKAFSWIKKTLEITEVATVPRAINPDVMGTLDVFGWERLDRVSVIRVNAAAPLQVVVSTVVPDDVIRLILGCSVSHTDTGVTHEVSLVKRRQPNTFNVGIPTDRQTIDFNMFSSMIGRTFTQEGDFLIGQVVDAPVAGVLILTYFFVDLAIGEYVPPL